MFAKRQSAVSVSLTYVRLCPFQSGEHRRLVLMCSAMVLAVNYDMELVARHP